MCRKEWSEKARRQDANFDVEVQARVTDNECLLKAKHLFDLQGKESNQTSRPKGGAFLHPPPAGKLVPSYVALQEAPPSSAKDPARVLESGVGTFRSGIRPSSRPRGTVKEKVRAKERAKSGPSEVVPLR